MNPKLSSAVSVVKISDTILEFFKSNTRQQVRLKVINDDILDLVLKLDGSRSIEQISREDDIDEESLRSLICYLSDKGVLDNTDPIEDFEDYQKFRRPIHFLNDYSSSHAQLVGFWDKLRSANIVIIGLGAVGSWVACSLAESGVNHFILFDPDNVDVSNLHRQYGYTEQDIGRLKADALSDRLLSYNDKIEVKKITKYLDGDALNCLNDEKIDLIINCADKPSVDQTSLWIGEYSMKRNIPHIVGGGYNLHLSLIGQTVIPGKTACVMCFQKQLEEENKIDPSRVKKLMIRNRKVGSFGPMCAIIANFVGMEAIKVLTGCTFPANANRRGEFDIYTMDIKYNVYKRVSDCKWCGENGKYHY